MFVIEILLPLHDNQGQPFPHAVFTAVRTELARRFGGVTAFTRSPAVGVWEDDDGVARHDEIVVFEVMSEQVDTSWWREYRAQLERTFKQEEILIRATATVRV